MTNPIRIGSRTSKLAVAQSEIIADSLRAKFPERTVEIVTTTTLGDNVQGTALYAFGGKPVWTTELEALLADGKVDLIAHSLKDVPSTLPDKFCLAAISARENPYDVLCVRSDLPYKSLNELPEHTVVGTSSIRRSAQLKRNYPGLVFKVVRGNINTRLAKLEDPEQGYSCIILAAAGLLRLDLGKHITQYLDNEMKYAVGQGAIGVEIAKDDKDTLELVKAIEDHDATIQCLAERSMMRKLEAGCSVPLGVKTSLDSDGILQAVLEEKVLDVETAEAFGLKLADLLIANGGAIILASVEKDKPTQ
ncbi:porphobilinogen deaminase, dipyromethane cofactor binding domain-containing protein [Lipomyces oligophaga]|uniref:porphobilinogen deaminase, dipyromethane cofactor binding domain-containing protein n=1 Tax=Lipomyces oligophaga TaxID=45792 RepID=UPI0034CEC81B